MNQKGLAPGLIAILIAIVVGGYLFYSNYNKITLTPSKQTAQPTSAPETIDWKVYINKTYGYSIKYPPELYIKEEPVTDKIVTLVFEKDKNLSYDPEKFFLIPTFEILVFEGKTLDDQVARFKSSGKEAELKEIELAGNKAYRAENINVNYIDENTTISEVGTTVSKNNNLFVINVRGNLNKQPELINIYNNMLTTFQLP